MGLPDDADPRARSPSHARLETFRKFVNHRRYDCVKYLTQIVQSRCRFTDLESHA